MKKARYIMIGGFLGSGKTTALAALAAHFTRRGQRVGLITNDQGSELVDTALLRSKGFATEEIPGGCFCCRFDKLVEAVRKLDAASSPEVYLAEPVGSCTDLVATVSYPLKRLHGSNYSLAPLSVLIDPVRAERVFGLNGGGNFSEKVLYIYRKQLEEADLIVIAKSDLIDEARVERLREKLASEFPQADVLSVSVQTGKGVESWLARIEGGTHGRREAMAVDYPTYAEGEALLGWLNATVSLRSPNLFDPGVILDSAARTIQESLEGFEIAHLKMAFHPEGRPGEIATINVVRSGESPHPNQMPRPATSGHLTINLRAEASPDQIREAVQAAVVRLEHDFSPLRARIEHLEHFRPGKPVPTHRLASCPAD